MIDSLQFMYMRYAGGPYPYFIQLSTTGNEANASVKYY